MHDLTAFNWLVWLAAVFTVTFFYSSVGHAEATGYLAALALVGVAPASAKVAVQIANIFVASIAFRRFYQTGHFDWNIFLSFTVASIPFAFLGSKIHISPQTYKIILGAVLSHCIAQGICTGCGSWPHTGIVGAECRTASDGRSK